MKRCRCLGDAGERGLEKWSVWSLDVWGNAEDGWDVNDRGRVGSIWLPPDAKDEHIRAALREAGFLRRAAVEISGDDTMIFVDDERNGKPIYQLDKELS